MNMYTHNVFICTTINTVCTYIDEQKKKIVSTDCFIRQKHSNRLITCNIYIQEFKHAHDEHVIQSFNIYINYYRDVPANYIQLKRLSLDFIIPTEIRF